MSDCCGGVEVEAVGEPGWLDAAADSGEVVRVPVVESHHSVSTAHVGGHHRGTTERHRHRDTTIETPP
jgi:hypothetical protein